MAEAPKNDKTEMNPRQPPEQETEQRREASEQGTSGAKADPREDVDPREEDGWAQPESSAQGAPSGRGLSLNLALGAARRRDAHA